MQSKSLSTKSDIYISLKENKKKDRKKEREKERSEASIARSPLRYSLPCPLEKATRSFSREIPAKGAGSSRSRE